MLIEWLLYKNVFRGLWWHNPNGYWRTVPHLQSGEWECLLSKDDRLPGKTENELLSCWRNRSGSDMYTYIYIYIQTCQLYCYAEAGKQLLYQDPNQMFLAARLTKKVHKNSSVTVSAMFPTYRLRQDSSVLGGHSTGTRLGDRSFQSLDRVSGTHCLSHCMTEISHLYSSKDFWRYFGLCRAAAHSDCCFFVPCTNILTYLLVT